MIPGPFRIAIGKADVTAIAYPAQAAATEVRPKGILLAHGAGAGQRHVAMLGTAERLCARGVSVVTFDFPYTERGAKIPDKNDVLEKTVCEVFADVRAKMEGHVLFAGGKSMGGRISSQVAAKGAIDPASLVFLGYPLHPPAKPEVLRDKHLPGVSAPMLFVQGTRDGFGTPAEIAPLIPKLAKGTRLFAVDGGDHSHGVLKRGGIPQDAVYAEIADVIVAWMDEVGSAARS